MGGVVAVPALARHPARHLVRSFCGTFDRASGAAAPPVLALQLSGQPDPLQRLPHEPAKPALLCRGASPKTAALDPRLSLAARIACRARAAVGSRARLPGEVG